MACRPQTMEQVSPENSARFKATANRQALSQNEAVRLIKNFEDFLGREIDPDEELDLLNAADLALQEAEWVREAIAGTQVMIPRKRAPQWVGGDFEHAQPLYLGVHDHERQFHAKARQEYELTRELMATYDL